MDDDPLTARLHRGGDKRLRPLARGAKQLFAAQVRGSVGVEEGQAPTRQDQAWREPVIHPAERLHVRVVAQRTKLIWNPRGW